MGSMRSFFFSVDSDPKKRSYEETTVDDILMTIPIQLTGVPCNLVADPWAVSRRRGPAVDGRHLRRHRREAFVNQGTATTRPACFPAHAGPLHQPPRSAGRGAAGHGDRYDQNARPGRLGTGHLSTRVCACEMLVRV